MKYSETFQNMASEDLDVSWGHQSAPIKTSVHPTTPGTNALASNSDTQQMGSLPPSKDSKNSQASALNEGDPYYGRVRSQIQSKVQYPNDLIQRHISGQVVVKLWVLASGALGQAEIANSSGHKELDLLAMKAVKLAAPFESFSGSESRQIVIPIYYKH